MKIETANNLHLTYCTNIHPGEEWQQVFANLQQHVLALKAQLAPTQSFGVGLRLADVATRELLEGDNLAHFQSWLLEQDLYVFTMNGFPYGGFHHRIVKDQVYAPDWSERSRFDYTLRLTKILAVLLPEGLDGGISTVPLSYKPWCEADSAAKEFVLKESSLNLALVAAEMIRIQQETGKQLHLDLEPEPDGLIENAAEVIDFFQNWLLPLGGAWLAEGLGISQEIAEAKLLQHVRICYDICHFAVEYEQPESVFTRLQAAGIKIGKIQISAAIKMMLPDHIWERHQVVERLHPFAESTYLHQVIERQPDGVLRRYSDLAIALPHLEQSTAQEWRTHFHVPIFIRDYGILQSTQSDIVTVLCLLKDYPLCQHLEIETYTWEVLPPELKTDVLTSIRREYEWVLAIFSTGTPNSGGSMFDQSGVKNYLPL